jgi:membrane protein implicated in regulation of membrane protease activity
MSSTSLSLALEFLTFSFFFPFFFLLLLLFCYLRLLALALSFFVFRHLVSMDCLGTYLGRRGARDRVRVFKVAESESQEAELTSTVLERGATTRSPLFAT